MQPIRKSIITNEVKNMLKQTRKQRMTKILGLLLSLLLLLPLAAFADEPVGRHYDDVPADSWFHDDIQYVTACGIMNGRAPALFVPDARITQAELATILYRIADCPDTDTVMGPDVLDAQAGAWYRDALLWAGGENIIDTLQAVDGVYAVPQAQRTRQSVVTALYRLSRYERIPTENSIDSFDGFSDAANLTQEAKDAWAWCIGNQIIRGYDDGTLKPLNAVTRKELAAMISRYIQNVQLPAQNKSREIELVIRSKTGNFTVGNAQGQTLEHDAQAGFTGDMHLWRYGMLVTDPVTFELSVTADSYFTYITDDKDCDFSVADHRAQNSAAAYLSVCGTGIARATVGWDAQQTPYYEAQLCTDTENVRVCGTLLHALTDTDLGSDVHIAVDGDEITVSGNSRVFTVYAGNISETFTKVEGQSVTVVITRSDAGTLITEKAG